MAILNSRRANESPVVKRQPPKESTRTSALLTAMRRQWGEHLFIFKVHGSPFQPRVVDLFGSFFGAAFAIEVKRPDNKVTPRQLKTLSDVRKSGGFETVLWEVNEAKKFFLNLLDTLNTMRYIDVTSPTTEVGRERKRIQLMSPAAKSKSAKAGKAATATKTSKRKSAPVEDEDDDLDDLEDLDDLDDFADEDEEDEDEDVEDDEDEDEEDEDDEPVVKTRTSKRAANDAKAAKAKSAKKASPVVVKKPAKTSKKTAPVDVKAVKKAKGNASNLQPRRIAEGFVGAQAIADELGTDAKRVRVLFRKLEVPKNADGTYAWKEGSRDYKAVVSKLKKEMA